MILSLGIDLFFFGVGYFGYVQDGVEVCVDLCVIIVLGELFGFGEVIYVVIVYDVFEVVCLDVFVGVFFEDFVEVILHVC